MTKLAFAICQQQRHRSAQSDQRFCCLLLSVLAKSKFQDSSLSVTEHAGLSLTWSKTPKTGFLLTRHI